MTASRPRFGSVVDRETSRLTKIFIESPTAVIRGLWKLAPKRRRSKAPWIILAAVTTFGAGIALDHSAREYVTTRATAELATLPPLTSMMGSRAALVEPTSAATASVDAPDTTTLEAPVANTVETAPPIAEAPPVEAAQPSVKAAPPIAKAPSVEAAPPSDNSKRTAATLKKAKVRVRRRNAPAR